MVSRRFILTVAALTGSVAASPAFAFKIRARYVPLESLPASEQMPENKSIVEQTHKSKRKKSGTKNASIGKKKYKLDPQFEPQDVSLLEAPFGLANEPGSIVIDPQNKFLYFIKDTQTARRYGVATGKEGLGWTGLANIKEKVEWPSWTPTDEMIKRDPQKYLRHKEGMPGGPDNPLGARAIYLYQGDLDTKIRIHGTTQPWTIGKAASNGCFRMVNDHVIELYDSVQIGAQVVVL